MFSWIFLDTNSTSANPDRSSSELSSEGDGLTNYDRSLHSAESSKSGRKVTLERRRPAATTQVPNASAATGIEYVSDASAASTSLLCLTGNRNGSRCVHKHFLVTYVICHSPDTQIVVMVSSAIFQANSLWTDHCYCTVMIGILCISLRIN